MHWVWICNATPFTYVKTHLSWTEGNAMARLVLLASLVAALFLAVEVLTMFVTLAAEVFSSDLRCFSCLVCRARAPRKKLRTRCSSTLRLAGSLLVRAAPHPATSLVLSWCLYACDWVYCRQNHYWSLRQDCPKDRWYVHFVSDLASLLSFSST